MERDPLFSTFDFMGKPRKVRIIGNLFSGMGAKDFKSAVVDVEDVETGELLEDVALSTLKPLILPD